MVKVLFTIFIYLFTLLLISCSIIYNKTGVMDLNEIGAKNQQLKTDIGYYYRVLPVKEYACVDNHHGGRSIDSSRWYTTQYIASTIFYSDGTMVKTTGISSGFRMEELYSRTLCNLIRSNALESLLLNFECGLRHSQEFKGKTVWGQGVYKVEKDSIIIQTFYNRHGDYYLYEEKGILLSDSSFVLTRSKDYRTKKEFKINIRYRFREMLDIPKEESYILKNFKK